MPPASDGKEFLVVFESSHVFFLGMSCFFSFFDENNQKCYFCETEIFVNTGPGWNSTRVICRKCSKKQEGK